MKAVVLTGHGGLDKLEYHEDWPEPDPGPGEVKIRVGACGLNNTDVNTRSGWYAKSVIEATTGDAYATVSDEDDGTWGGSGIGFPRIQGADAVGEVVALGEGAPDDMLGKRVIVDCWMRDWSDPLDRNKTGYFGSERDGGFAEYTVLPVQNARVIDSPMTDAELATFSCSYSTAEGMLSRAGVGPEDTVLITGASGGVGSALIQLAKRRGARVVALASKSKHAALAPLEPDLLLDRDPGPLDAALEGGLGVPAVSVVADIAGGPMFPRLLDVLERGGRYVTSGAIAGPIVELDLRTLYLQDLTLYGSTVIPPQIFTDLLGYLKRGELKPQLAATYPLSEFHAAQTAFIEKAHVGNIVVIP